jgi:hypothetical protein
MQNQKRNYEKIRYPENEPESCNVLLPIGNLYDLIPKKSLLNFCYGLDQCILLNRLACFFFEHWVSSFKTEPKEFLKFKTYST